MVQTCYNVPSKGHIFAGFFIAITFITLLSSIPEAFGQLESITIDGPKTVLYDSVFTFQIVVEGVSRASYGDFSVNVAIVEKESGHVITEQPGYLLSGKNSMTWSGKEYGTSKNLVTLAPNVPHVFRIQYLLNTWEYEFLPVATVEELSQTESTTNEATIPKAKIPDWINNTMQWYIDGIVSEKEMINALQFLIKEGIIKL